MLQCFLLLPYFVQFLLAKHVFIDDIDTDSVIGTEISLSYQNEPKETVLRRWLNGARTLVELSKRDTLSKENLPNDHHSFIESNLTSNHPDQRERSKPLSGRPTTMRERDTLMKELDTAIKGNGYRYQPNTNSKDHSQTPQHRIPTSPHFSTHNPPPSLHDSSPIRVEIIPIPLHTDSHHNTPLSSDLSDSEGFCPANLTSEILPESLRNRTDELLNLSSRNKPLIVFQPDDRMNLPNSSFPFSAVGLLVSTRGICTGTMVSPTLIVTASHCIPWRDDGTVDKIRFLPAFSHYSSPFPSPPISTIFAFTRCASRLNTLQSAFDLAVVHLKQPIGTHTGFFGTIAFEPKMMKMRDFMNIGYPQPAGGIKAGIIPVWQTGGKLNRGKEFGVGTLQSYLIETQMDFTKGHSGGPVFAWFGDDVYPSIVGIVSSEAQGTPENPEGRNHLAGGSSLTHLVNHAISYSQLERESQQ
ncbi:putative trypsin-like peptidase domain-containing protein [Blattamonas nauphoetae]|uniref:Trypsin-like peptidase domain-containing protein n=1 Tax=Blattamonas nauphoetae TaxID=2049346 RepID=A0ABQ9XPW0_9EUKA|nr:putative trypsin-like peptidase domain-containing protein [Blattamonas nauphoetae]